MKFWIACLLASLMLTGFGVWAAQPQYLTVDHSSEVLIDRATIKAMWKRELPAARLAKLYPVKKWGFASEVDGGFNASNTCVVTARAMLLPRRGKVLSLTPKKAATAFDALPNATREQCSELARKKLEEAMQAVVAGLVAT
jgi:hypothetical protein